MAVSVEYLRGASNTPRGAIFLLICHNLGCFCHRKRNMNYLSDNALAASNDDTLAVSHPRSGLLLPFLVVTVVFTVMMISVHLPVLVPVKEAWIYGSITLSTFIGLHLPHKDLDDANSTETGKRRRRKDAGEKTQGKRRRGNDAGETTQGKPTQGRLTQGKRCMGNDAGETTQG